MNEAEVVSIVARHRGEGGGLIAILEEVQARYGYLPADAIKTVADETGRSLVDVYGVATFYRWFTLKPRGEHLMSCCVGTACHVRGAPKVVEEMQGRLGIEPGGTTSDRQFTLETVNCLGACALGPIVVADGHYFSNVSAQGVKGIVERVGAGLDRVEVRGNPNVFPVEVNCARCNHGLNDRRYLVDDCPAIRVTISCGQWHGRLLLSSLYGSYNIECEYELPMGSIANFFCPHCHGELRGGTDCPLCGAPMVPMSVRPNGMIQICSRRGCRQHMLDLEGVNF